jgi:hypothetical protein
MTNDEIQALEARLRELRREQKAEEQRRRDSVKPVYEFLLEPVEERAGSFGGDRLFDEDCRFYTLTGRVTNKDELEAVGAGMQVFEGRMRYLYNGATGKFACAVGGGSIFLSTKEGWAELSSYIDYNPKGGDVSEIVSRHRNKEAQ